ncbi:hypothetical protein MPSEU_000357100 [Mayamaea pseudoterrestris]|nr:hypothetical protein MPSEU_000357100 [Mayamaea pseudoterrestris]
MPSFLQCLCALLVLALASAQSPAPSQVPSRTPSRTPSRAPSAPPSAAKGPVAPTAPVVAPVAAPVVAPTGVPPNASPNAVKPPARAPSSRTRMPSTGNNNVRDDLDADAVRCLDRVKQRCSCGLYLRDQDACYRGVLASSYCENPNRALLRRTYRRFCKRNCQEYSRTKFLFFRSQPVYVCEEGV